MNRRIVGLAYPGAGRREVQGVSPSFGGESRAGISRDEVAKDAVRAGELPVSVNSLNECQLVILRRELLRTGPSLEAILVVLQMLIVAQVDLHLGNP